MSDANIHPLTRLPHRHSACERTHEYPSGPVHQPQDCQSELKAKKKTAKLSKSECGCNITHLSTAFAGVVIPSIEAIILSIEAIIFSIEVSLLILSIEASIH